MSSLNSTKTDELDYLFLPIVTPAHQNGEEKNQGTDMSGKEG